MKFRVTMRDPDALRYAVRDAVIPTKFQNLSEDEAELARDRIVAATRQSCTRWFPYGECVTLEIDTKAKTCTVIEVGD